MNLRMMMSMRDARPAIFCARAAIAARNTASKTLLSGPRLLGFAFRFSLGQVVQGDLLAFGPGWMHLRQESADVPSDLGVSFAFGDVVNDVPTALHFATGCNEGRFTRLRLIAGSTNVRSKFRLNIGGRVALIGTKAPSVFATRVAPRTARSVAFAAMPCSRR